MAKCPECGGGVPFWRSQWALGKPFPCKNCDASLQYDRQYAAPLIALGIYYLAKPADGSFVQHLAVLAPLLLGLLAYSFFGMRPRLVQSGSSPDS